MEKKDTGGGWGASSHVCTKAMLQLASFTIYSIFYMWDQQRRCKKRDQKAWKWKAYCLAALILLSLVQRQLSRQPQYLQEAWRKDLGRRWHSHSCFATDLLCILGQTIQGQIWNSKVWPQRAKQRCEMDLQVSCEVSTDNTEPHSSGLAKGKLTESSQTWLLLVNMAEIWIFPCQTLAKHKQYWRDRKQGKQVPRSYAHENLWFSDF